MERTGGKERRYTEFRHKELKIDRQKEGDFFLSILIL